MPRLVVFDLDGTISRRDTLVPYVLRHALRHRPWRLLLLPAMLPVLLRFIAGQSDRGELKGRLIALLLGGLQHADIDDWNARYLPRLLRRGLFAGALERIASHRGAGDHLVLMSASVDLYVPEIGRRLGFAETVCSGVHWRGDALDGRLATPNRRDEEKARCFRELAARFAGRQTSAYGNSSSDLPHLVLADAPVLVNARGPLRQAAERSGRPFEFVYWR